MSILFVDDDQSILDLYEHKLSKNFPMKVHTALSAVEAFKLLAKENIELVVSDICMPEYSGIELCQTLKEKVPNLPVILLSSKMVLSPKEAIEIGADYFFSKDKAVEDQLFEVIESLISPRYSEKVPNI